MRKIYWRIRYKLHKFRIWWIYRDNIPWNEYDEEYKCPCCGWDPEDSYYENSYLGSSNFHTGHEGNRYWTEKWECPRCGTVFEFDTGD